MHQFSEYYLNILIIPLHVFDGQYFNIYSKNNFCFFQYKFLKSFVCLSIFSKHISSINAKTQMTHLKSQEGRKDVLLSLSITKVFRIYEDGFSSKILHSQHTKGKQIL
jgi:hypothetical protein